MDQTLRPAPLCSFPLQITAFLLLLMLTGFSSSAFAARFYVRVTATGSGTGSGWANASSNLQGIINGASSGDEVWVAGGTYQLASGQSFAMKEGVKIYGGFAGAEVNLTDRNLTITANKSILRGNGASVIVNNNNLLTNAALLDGFTISGASNTAGISNTSCSPKLVNLIISGNTAGGISNETASPVLIKCNITGNTASDFGGGIENRGSSPILTNCAITGNSAPQGSGIYNSASSPVLTNCTIGGNAGVGGMFNISNSSPKLRNSVISGNKNTNNNANIRNDFTSATTVKYSLVQNSFVPGDNTSNPNDFNIPGEADPLFVDAANGDYRLQLCSPALNKGSNTYFDSGQTPDLSAINKDLDGFSRFYNLGTVDMGAYEYQGSAPSGAAGVRYVKTGGTGSGATWGCAVGDLQLAIDLSSSGEQLWVAGGTYQPANDKCFKMKEGVKIYGNFKGTETALADRDLTDATYKSILRSSNSGVIRNDQVQLTNAAVLDGFTITDSKNLPAIINSSSSPMMVNLIITGNLVLGAISNSASSPILINCAIVGNTTIHSGGGIYNSSSSPVLINCTIAGNVSNTFGSAGMYNINNSSPTLFNCIVAGNKSGSGNTSGIFNETGSSAVIKYSLVQFNNGEVGNSGTPPDHNIQGDADPLFVNTAGGDYRLQACSPVINKGGNVFYDGGQTPDISAVTKDLGGNARFYNAGVVDMGAYEYQGNLAGVSGVWFVKEGGTGSGKSWDCAAGNLQLAINSAVSGEQIWVAGGTYQPSSLTSFRMKEGVKIYGNFAGTEVTLAGRNPALTANRSTLQGIYDNSYTIDNSTNSLTTAALLDGFTFALGTVSIRNSGSSPMLVNLVITGNDRGGPGISNINSSPVLINCAIFNNRSSAISNSTSSPILINCTIGGNGFTGSAAGIKNEINSSPTIKNSIIYGNFRGIDNLTGSASTIQHSLVQGLAVDPANHNISGDTDPLFVDAGNGNYRLQPCSPIVNKGFDFYGTGQTPDLSAITTDLDNNPRIRESIVDIGAYEFGGAARELAIDGNEASATVSGDLILTTNGSNCKLLAYLSPKGGAALNGVITAKVWVASAQPANFLKRHYQIKPETNAPNATAKLTLYFTQQEFTDFNVGSSLKLPVNAQDAENYKANLRIEKRSGETNDGSGLPNSYTGSIATFKPSEANGNVLWNADANRWEVSFEVTGFSGFFVKTVESALPLHLFSFTASKEAGNNLLQWSTASEVNTDYFEVQSSVNAKSFGKIAVVSAAGNGDHQYSYVDRTNYGGIIYYRLKMTDRAADQADGAFTYSKIISLAGNGNFAAAYPNPAQATLTFQVTSALIKTTATLYDVTGRKLQTIVITTSQQQIDIRSLASGQYILKFADGTMERFVKE